MTTPNAAARGASPFYRLAWAFYLALAVAALLWLGAQRGRIELSLFFEPESWPVDLAAGAGLGALLLALWFGLRHLSAGARALEAELARLVAPLTTAEALALAFLSGLAEELFFRGAVQGALGLAPAALLFALLHAGPGKSFRIWTLFALAGGLLFGGWVAMRGALGAAIFGHMLVNGFNLVRLTRYRVECVPDDKTGPAIDG